MSVGLGGDGDELFAIADVEDAFSVKLDKSDAPRWLTAGNVFDSLRNALPPEERDKRELWDRFATALCHGTGVDPTKIERGSPLLSESRHWVRLANASAVLWIVMLGSAIAVALAGLAGR